MAHDLLIERNTLHERTALTHNENLKVGVFLCMCCSLSSTVSRALSQKALLFVCSLCVLLCWHVTYDLTRSFYTISIVCFP